MLNNEDALLFIRGERPVKDQKYDLLKHPRVKQTPDGGGPAFQYGALKHAVTAITCFKAEEEVMEQSIEENGAAGPYGVWSEEELNLYFGA